MAASFTTGTNSSSFVGMLLSKILCGKDAGAMSSAEIVVPSSKANASSGENVAFTGFSSVRVSVDSSVASSGFSFFFAIVFLLLFYFLKL
ncbi:MAG: hypothetical protein IJ937_09235, partial [Treponema sp.]|nr:hypothetical protein [Treponema sp.]